MSNKKGKKKEVKRGVLGEPADPERLPDRKLEGVRASPSLQHEMIPYREESKKRGQRSSDEVLYSSHRRSYGETIRARNDHFRGGGKYIKKNEYEAGTLIDPHSPKQEYLCVSCCKRGKKEWRG